MIDLIKNPRFLEALCFIIAALTLQFAPEYAVNVTTLLATIVATLKILKVVPEVRLSSRLRNKKKTAVKKK